MTKRKRETYCFTCGELVGVWQTSWNRTFSGASPQFPSLPKTSRHHLEGGQVCAGSMLTVHPNMIMGVSA